MLIELQIHSSTMTQYFQFVTFTEQTNKLTPVHFDGIPRRELHEKLTYKLPSCALRTLCDLIHLNNRSFSDITPNPGQRTINHIPN
ncbi:hypothetical protein T02_15333 [Trichinella nativa]|uniref:Uncharacterized protein n=1 Tax=Trichinella nativa TaxID=6335 RepID=A0A0V1KNZ5_9BILA|nr:hypothetical protein T06_14876 [Trichinella sp. T6]KRX73831.1 hypothetical protein T06_7484 [Trichinella sp. T6]KRZ49085.1 hypothetical protein T02_15333 [Trichinella nativa]